MKNYVPSFNEYTHINECNDDPEVIDGFDTLMSALMSYIDDEGDAQENGVEKRNAIAAIMAKWNNEDVNLSECLRELADVVETIN